MRKVHEVVDYYNRALEIYAGILQSESDSALQSEAQKKSGDIEQSWDCIRNASGGGGTGREL